MNREIKFRAWDKDKKEIREVTGINWYDEYLWVDETPMSGDKLPIDGTPLMQYTGLKDKNGVEIYEGDIVKTDTGIGDICFGGRSCFIIIYKERQNNTKCWSLLGDKRTEQLVEVIGNIYQNKDLLN